MNIAILFHRLGPYHHTRLLALVDQCSLSAIEFSTVDNTYAWDVLRTEGYRVTTLFTDADVDTKPACVVTDRMNNVLCETNAEVVAIPGWSSPAAIAALSWCCKTNIPAVLMAESRASDEPRAWWKEWIKSRIVRLFSSALVAGTPHVDYVTDLGLARERVFIGYDVVDNNHFAIGSDAARRDAVALRLEYALPEHYFLAMNRFIKKKNLSRLLEAYASYVKQAGSEAWDLVLIGDGQLKSALTEQLASLGISDRVRLPGFIQHNETPIYYGLAEAFIHASTTEQWGLVVNEAMASGLPILVSERCGCAPDLVRNGVNGFTFDPYNIGDMTSRMLQMSGVACNLATLGQASREIISHWQPKTFAENLLNAAKLACSVPRAKASVFDKALLWVVMRR